MSARRWLSKPLRCKFGLHKWERNDPRLLPYRDGIPTWVWTCRICPVRHWWI